MRLPPSTHLQKCFKLPNPGAKLFYHCEPDATNMIYSDTPAIDGGEIQAHIFMFRNITRRPKDINLLIHKSVTACRANKNTYGALKQFVIHKMK